MAHGIYLSEEELDILHCRGTGVSHCANSNIRCTLSLNTSSGLEHFNGGHSGSSWDFAVRLAFNMTSQSMYLYITITSQSMHLCITITDIFSELLVITLCIKTFSFNILMFNII